MPTSHPRISVTKDPELAEALERGRELLSSRAPEATLMRDLAVHGARLLGAEMAARERALRDLSDHDWLDTRLDSEALARVESELLPIDL